MHATVALPRALQPCPENKAFYFRDGRVARELPTFRDALVETDVANVEFHRNHFHFWLGEVLDEPRLAKETESLGRDRLTSPDRLRDTLVELIDGRVHELQRTRRR